MPKLINRFSEAALTKIGLSIISIGLFSMWFINSRIGLYIAVLLFSIGAGLSRPMITTRISEKAKEDERGRIMGVVDSLGSIAQIIGPFIGGFLIQSFYPGVLGVVAAVFVIIALLIDVFNSKKVKKQGVKD